MCGDIMSIWNVKYVVNGLTHLTGIVSVVLMSVEDKPENRHSVNTKSQINTKKHYNAGINHQQGQVLKSDIEANLRPKSWLLSVLRSIRNATLKNERRGIENMATGEEIITQDILTEKPLNRSLIYLVTNALNVAVRQLRLTISFRYQKAAQTTLITCSHYANHVTLGKVTDESNL